ERGAIDRAEEQYVVDDAHPGPEERERQADDLVGVAGWPGRQENERNAEDVGDDMHRPDGLVVALKDLQELLGGEREHWTPPQRSAAAAYRLCRDPLHRLP